jgi:hypothetical protein
MIAVASTPSLASSSSGPSNASVATSKETVKPMPAEAAAPINTGQVTVSRAPPSIGRVASQVAPRIPTGLPMTYAAMIPSVTGDVIAPDSVSESSRMPALASAKSGTITRLVHGCNRYCRRSLGEIEPARLARAE